MKKIVSLIVSLSISFLFLINANAAVELGDITVVGDNAGLVIRLFAISSG